MAQLVLRIASLPDSALDAATAFHREWLPRARNGDWDVVLVFQPASFDHRGWRLAVVQDLAREAAPRRVNALVGSDEQAIAMAAEWLASAPGVTGQLLALA